MSTGPDNHWHLDKRVNVGHLLTTATILGSVMWWGSTVETRLGVLDAKQQAAAVRQEQLREDIKSRLDRIETKLDRVIEDR